MKDHELGHYYTLGHLTQFSGLTDRTLRTYLSNGILEGEKINGVWHFTKEQTYAFLCHPFVRPAILAKNNAIVSDFLQTTAQTGDRICVILDLPDCDRDSTAAFFCDAICTGDFRDLRFAFDGIETPRVTLSGPMKQVLSLINSYKSNR